MAVAHVNGVDLYYELHGAGEPVALVHGSWADAARWSLVLPGLGESFRVLVYDRGGHSRSQAPEAVGRIDDEGEDLAVLPGVALPRPGPRGDELVGWEHRVAPGLSAAGAVPVADVSRAPGLGPARRRPGGWRAPRRGRGQPGGRRPRDRGGRPRGSGAAVRRRGRVRPRGVGAGLPPEVREMFVRNAATFLEELHDPDRAGHAPQSTTPGVYTRLVVAALRRAGQYAM